MKSVESILVATDFSEEAAWAAARASSIAKETGARSVLVHVLPDSIPAALHVQAASRAQQALALVVEDMKGKGLRFEPRLLSGSIPEQLAGAAGELDLAVAGAHGTDLLRDFAMGRTCDHLVRQSRRPVLIVKRPPERPYERVVAAVDFSEPSRQAAAFALQVAPKADVHFVHAFEVEFESTLRLVGTEEDKVQAYRQQARERAMNAMEQLVGRLGLPPELVWRVVEHGYPPRVILEQAEKIGAQLVVVGKHAAGMLERLLIGSVALQVLQQAQCDVLVVPARGS